MSSLRGVLSTRQESALSETVVRWIESDYCCGNYTVFNNVVSNFCNNFFKC